MAFKRLWPRLRLIIIGLIAASGAVIVVGRTVVTSSRVAQQRAMIERARASLRAGIGSEVRFASAGARGEDVRASLDSMAEFIRYRSGLALDDEVKGRLAHMEERVLNGNGRRITVGELGGLFTTILVERLHDCTDSEIERAADDLTNINRPLQGFDRRTEKKNYLDKPNDAQSHVARSIEGDGSDPSGTAADLQRIVMRFNGQGEMTREAFILKAKNLRDRFRSPLQQVALVGITRQMITQAVRNRVESLGAALPEQWAVAQTDGLTPSQAFLIAYSTLSDDALGHSSEALRNLGAQLTQTWKAATGEAISYDGRMPYGTGGYLFSSPLDLAFDQRTISRLLKLLDERSAK
jgi:hypothetical protein